MGYETKLIIGSTHRQLDGDIYLRPCMVIDLCKTDSNEILELANAVGDGKIYYYADDGNTQIREDRYGVKFTVHDIDTIIDIISRLKVDSEYRRFEWAFSSLTSIRDNNGEGMKVILFGH